MLGTRLLADILDSKGREPSKILINRTLGAKRMLIRCVEGVIIALHPEALMLLGVRVNHRTELMKLKERRGLM
jgi:hypothetical protein